MRQTLQLAALTLALTATTATHAQIHFPQHTPKNKVTHEDLSWLALFATPEPDGRENELIRDPRFKPFIREHLKAPQTFWNDNQSLADTIMDFLAVPGKVLLDDNRFLSIDGCVLHFCPSRGLVFIDLGADHPLIAFAAIDWTKDNKTTTDSGAEYTMWIFANRALTSSDDKDSPTHIPAALTRALALWSSHPSSGSTTLQHITTTILVDPDGTPHQVPPATVGVNSLAAPKSEPANQPPAAPTQQPSTGSNQ
jgi:hypothetical protein